jgi:hypothetical protein
VVHSGWLHGGTPASSWSRPHGRMLSPSHGCSNGTTQFPDMYISDICITEENGLTRLVRIYLLDNF